MNRTTAITHPKRGQTLPFFVLALTVLLGFTVMAIDVGLLHEGRRRTRKPSRTLPVMKSDPRRYLERRDYLPSDPERVKRGQANFAATMAFLLAACIIAFFLGLVIAMDIGRFN